MDSVADILGIHSASSTTIQEEHSTLIGENLDFEQTLFYSQEPSSDTWQLVPLYMESVYQTLVWQIGFDGSCLVILHGYLGGGIQRKTRDITTNTSGRNLQQQALLEAKHRYQKMYHKGYRPVADDTPLCQEHPKPMLAYEYKEKKVPKFPVGVQVKMDGIRSLANQVGDTVQLRSRENRQQPHLNHIRDELAPLFFYLPPGSHLDGELYSETLTFNEITSAVRTTKRLHPKNIEVKYYIFDIIVPGRQHDLVYEDRHKILEEAFNNYIQDSHNPTNITIVPWVTANSHQEIMDYHDLFVQAGYEGAIVRKLGSSYTRQEAIYVSRRSNNILKVKRFIDEEAIVVAVTDGEGTEKGAAIFMLKDTRGNVFPVRPQGTIEARRGWYATPSTVIGKEYTYRYFELTPDQIPRFPVGVGFRDYE